MKLDIIVTHYNEPYNVIKPFFDMMEIQRMVDFSRFRVILVHDGEQCSLPELSARSFPFELVELSIPHKGVSAARNAGTDYSDADWIMFCDCDDTFVSIYSMHEIMSVVDTDKYDLLWLPYYVERHDCPDRYVMNMGDVIMIHGKLFRRSFLIEKSLRFCEDLYYSEDMAFVSLVNYEVDQSRVGKINPNMPLYAYTSRQESITVNPAYKFRNMIGLFKKQVYMVNELRKRGLDNEVKYYAARAMTDAYLTLCREDLEEDRTEFDKEAQEFYKKNREDIKSVEDSAIETLLSSSLSEFMFLTNNVSVGIPFGKWLDAWVHAHHLDE